MLNRNSILLITGGVIVLVIAALFGTRLLSGEDNWICQDGQWVKHGNPSAPAPTTGCGTVQPSGQSQDQNNNQNQTKPTSGIFEGFITESSYNYLKVKSDTTSEEKFFVIDDNSNLLGVDNKQIPDLNGLKTGYKVRVSWEEKGDSNGERIEWVKQLNVLEDNAQEVHQTKLDSPKLNQIMTSPFTVTGYMPGNWYTEATAQVVLEDSNGKMLGSAPAQAQGEWMTDKLVPFKAKLTFKASTTPTGWLILRADNPSGLPQNNKEEKYKVTLWPAVKIYFNNSKLNPNSTDCSLVYPVDRYIAPTVQVGTAALKQLLNGPTTQEKNNGFTTAINSGVKLQSLTISNGVAKADFSEDLERNIGGSCRVAEIRSQITQTLKQFPTVKQVIISINGHTEDILQP